MWRRRSGGGDAEAASCTTQNRRVGKAKRAHHKRWIVCGADAWARRYAPLPTLRRERKSNLLIVFADFGVAAQHAVHRGEHVAHALFRHRALDHDDELRLVR